MFFYLLVVKASTVCMENRQKDVLQVIFFVVIGKTILVHTKLHVTLDTFAHHRSRHTPRWTHATSPFRGTMAMQVLIVMCVQSSDVSIWFWDSRRACFTCETSHCIEENCSATTWVKQQNLNWQKSELLQSIWWKCFLPLPKNRYSVAC